MRSILFFLVALVPLLAGAQDSAYKRMLDRWQQENQFSGTVLVSKGGRLVWAGATGQSDREAKKSVRTTTPFRITALTQTFTAVMVLQLQEEGLLKLYDTIGKYLPGYAGPARDKVTIYNLLTYSSGIPDCGGGNAHDIDRKPIAADSFINRFCSAPLVFEPGTRSQRNNADYILLGKIIENVTRRTYMDNLERRILRPLRMDATGYVDDVKPVPGLARSYSFKDSATGLSPDPFDMSGNYYGAGALYSTGFDLLRFDRAIFHNELLRAPTLKQMLQADPKLGNVALGFWYSDAQKEGVDTPYVFRPGAIRGNRGYWMHAMSTDVAVIVLSNTDRGDLQAISKELYEMVAGRKKQAP